MNRKSRVASILNILFSVLSTAGVGVLSYIIIIVTIAAVKIPPKKADIFSLTILFNL